VALLALVMLVVSDEHVGGVGDEGTVQSGAGYSSLSRPVAYLCSRLEISV
jgi:hypothetical protein